MTNEQLAKKFEKFRNVIKNTSVVKFGSKVW